MPAQLAQSWKKFCDNNPGFDTACGRICTKFGATLQEMEAAIADIASSKGAKAAKQALDDGQNAKQMIERVLASLAGCVAKQKDAQMLNDFKIVSSAIAKQIAEF